MFFSISVPIDRASLDCLPSGTATRDLDTPRGRAHLGEVELTPQTAPASAAPFAGLVRSPLFFGGAARQRHQGVDLRAAEIVNLSLALGSHNPFGR